MRTRARANDKCAVIWYFWNMLFNMYLMTMLMALAMAMVIYILLLPLWIGKQNDTIVCNKECCTRFGRLHRLLGTISMGLWNVEWLRAKYHHSFVYVFQMNTNGCQLLKSWLLARVHQTRFLLYGRLRAQAEACVCWHRP